MFFGTLHINFNTCWSTKLGTKTILTLSLVLKKVWWLTLQKCCLLVHNIIGQCLYTRNIAVSTLRIAQIMVSSENDVSFYSSCIQVRLSTAQLLSSSSGWKQTEINDTELENGEILFIFKKTKTKTQTNKNASDLYYTTPPVWLVLQPSLST